jgi:REP element-mobilizing transposase RayT
MNMSEPLAYLLTWTTYGTWLPGDQRGWVDRQRQNGIGPILPPEPAREAFARDRMKEPPFILDAKCRQVISEVIYQTCDIRGWFLHALAVQSNHVHVVISAADIAPKQIIGASKANGSRVLKEKYSEHNRKHWWTRGGSTRYLNSKESVNHAIAYVENQ